MVILKPSKTSMGHCLNPISMWHVHTKGRFGHTILKAKTMFVNKKCVERLKKKKIYKTFNFVFINRIFINYFLKCYFFPLCS